MHNVGPRDPGTYCLLKDGRLQTVGSKQPLLKSEDLADVKYISWTARDGKTNNGYLVLQPQYRGSTNCGLDFYLSAFINGGQGGYRMQGDKDDGALHLGKEGLADAARNPQIHQCAILLIHGDVDQRVPPAHVRKYLKDLEKYNKPHKHVELKDADHFSNTLFYDHQITLYRSLIDFLKNDCGPGGL